MSKRKGFTFIEITLFLAVTAALFIGVAAGVSNSIFQQQYNDSTQSFFEFLKGVYSEVSNPQGAGKGDSDSAIYGRMIVFGETTDLAGNPVPDTEQQIFTYDVVGDAVSSGTGDVKQLLKALHANVVFVERKNNVILSVEFALPEKYTPRWGAQIETISGSPVKKTILVVRHPRSGTINTLVLDDAIQVNEAMKSASSCISKSSCPVITDILTSRIDGFSTDKEVDFCVDPYGLDDSGGTPRRNIRILENARNSSSVQLLELENRDVDEKGEKKESYNRCL